MSKLFSAVYLCFFFMWQILNIKNDKFYYIEAAELLVLKRHKQKSRSKLYLNCFSYFL